MMRAHETVWYNCLQIIKDNIPNESFNTWFKPIVPLKLEQNVLIIQVPTAFFYEYLEVHYVDLLKKVLQKELGSNAKLEYSIMVDSSNNGKSMRIPEGNNTPLVNAPVNVKLKQNSQMLHPYLSPGIKKVKVESNLNNNYSYDNFVEGKCNQIASTAGKTIAANPGHTAFNPMFIFGKAGLGKTHLAQAIGIEVKKNFADKKRVIYVPANKFQTQYSDAARRNNRNDFLYFYQNIDVLIIDDIHEFAKKTGTQDTFFHIFNHLHQTNKQIILTADRPPDEIEGLSERLISRFKWALVAEITPPDFETRVAILRKKAKLSGIDLDENIITYIAENISNNVRELEGALISLIAHSTSLKKDITYEFAVKIIDNLSKKPKKDINIAQIQKVVCNYYGLQPDALKSKSRKREIVQARQITMYFAKKFTKKSLSLIGAEIGNKNHATVLYATKTVQDLADTDKAFKASLAEIEKKINHDF